MRADDGIRNAAAQLKRNVFVLGQYQEGIVQVDKPGQVENELENRWVHVGAARHISEDWLTAPPRTTEWIIWIK